MASTYGIYKNWKNANALVEDLKNGCTEKYLEEGIYNTIRACFNGIYDTASWNRKYYFNLKSNWALLKKHDYDAVLQNIADWMVKVDDRFDGENWTEKQSKKPTTKLITGENELQNFYDIITSEENDVPVHRENSNRTIFLHDVDFEIDDEDYDRIYFNCQRYDMYKEGIKAVVTELLNEAGIMNFRINLRFAEIKFYQ